MSELENDTFDEYVRGNLSRRQFVARASVLGMSGGLIAFLAACGDDTKTSATTTTKAGSSTSAAGSTSAGATTTAGGGKPAGTIKIGALAPSAGIEPLKVGDVGGLQILGQVGDYLTISGSNLTLSPGIAEKWEPTGAKDGKEWTFTIRQGVTFHDGTPLSPDDVVATFDRLADPANKSNALSVFKGVLTKGNVKANGQTVVFTLDAPNGNFPYLVSTDNYNAIILKKDYAGDFESKPVATGAWKIDKYTPKQGVSLVRNDAYWGAKPAFDRAEWTFFADEAAMVLALQAGTIDLAHNVSISGGKALEGGFAPTIVKSTAHRQLHMRTDMDPWKDKRTRQAIALTLNRPDIIKGLFDGKADLGNDSPFAPAFPSTDTSVAQRAQDIAKAKSLLQATGQDKGFDVQLNAIKVNEVPDYATLVQNAAKAIGVNVKTVVQESGEFYGDGVYGKSPWLDAVMGIVDYGHRGVPNVFLGAPLLSDGTWNSAHFKNPTYDGYVRDYFAALDVNGQKAAAKKIQELLLDETPIIFSYFYNYSSWSKKDIKGFEITGMGHLFLNKATRG
jgi:peptide/nickel transport system substrate-binding protein